VESVPAGAWTKVTFVTDKQDGKKHLEGSKVPGDRRVRRNMSGRVSLMGGKCSSDTIEYQYRTKRYAGVRIKNETETAVRAEVAKVRGNGRRLRASSRLSLAIIAGGLNWLTGVKAAERGLCECPHCSADIMALSLSNLPACYCLSLHYGVGRTRLAVVDVERQVRASLRRVRTRPRHSARESLPQGEEVRLVDFGMREGAPMVRPLMQRIQGACSCPRCMADTLAYGLNRFRPRYGVEVRGKLRVPPHELEFIRHELMTVLHDAAVAVAENPRHDSPGSA